MIIALPDYNLYIKYSAYADLYRSVMEKLKDNGVERTTERVVIEAITVAADMLIGSISMQSISAEDSVDQFIDKKLYNNSAKEYIKSTLEARGKFEETVKGCSRPTVATVSKKIRSVVTGLEGRLIREA